MVRGNAIPFLGGTCPFLAILARPELSRRDADEALEVKGELALGREAGAGGHLPQEAATVSLQDRSDTPE
jgi:hypothetical protein